MQLTDGDHIRGLLAAYCRLIDAGDFAGVGELMASAVLRTHDGTAIATGADEVAALYAGLVRLHDDGTPMTQHLVANTAFEEPGEAGSVPEGPGDSVRATSSYLVLQVTGDQQLEPIATGSYLDTFATDERGRWHFTERRLGIGRSGNLAQHLTLSIGDLSRAPPPTVGPRVIVITGAASGIGYATAEMFRDAGDIVFGLDIHATVPEGVTYVECNVGDRASVDAAIAVCAQHGRIDVLANVAGIVQFGRFEQITDAEWDRVHAVDLKGPFMMMQAALPHLKACRGNIVNVSSVAGRVPQGYTTAYAAAKGGLTMLTRALALELAPDRIRVNVICPGTVDTPIVSHVASIFPDDLDPRVADRLMMMLPGRAISPSEIAAAIRYLASPDARMVTGTVLAVDGGMS